MDFRSAARPLVLVIIAVGTVMAGIVIVSSRSDDDRRKGDETSKRLTRAGYIASADQLCTRLDGQLESLNARIRHVFGLHADEADGLRAIANLLKEGSRRRREGQKRFRELGLPRVDHRVVEMVRALYDGQTALVERMAETAARRDLRGFALLTLELGDMARRTEHLAAGYGFRVCGRRASAPAV